MRVFGLITLFIGLSKGIFAQSGAMVPYQSLMEVNPSFAGSNGNVRDQLFHSLSSFGPNNDPNSFSASNSFDMYLASCKSGVGISLNHEEWSNFHKSSSGSLTFSRHITINDRLKIIPSLQAGLGIEQRNQGYYATSVYFTPGSNSNWVRREYLTVDAGVLVKYKHFYGGLGVFNINHPDVGIFSVQRIRPVYNLHASYNLEISPNLLIHLQDQHTIYSTYNSIESRLSVDALLFKHFIYGFGYTVRSSVTMNAGFRLNRFTMQIALEHDFWYWRVPDSYINSCQLMLAFNFRKAELRNVVTDFEAW